MNNVPGTETTAIRVTGMTCDNCARRVDRALRTLPGVKDVEVDRASAVVKVTFDRSVVDIFAMHDALQKAGYKPVSA
jgi:Cu+-exporting ATPase